MPLAAAAALVIAGVSLAILVGTTLRAQAAFATAAQAQLRQAAQRSEARRLEEARRHEERRERLMEEAAATEATEATTTPDISPTALSEGLSPRLRFRVLLLDHDDTTVRGTEEVHYPAHVESVRVLRPELEPVSLEGWFQKNHEPGVSCYLKSLFTPELMEEEQRIWTKAMEDKVPTFYEGIAELLSEFRARGGCVAVVSHSPAEVIQRHYSAHPWAEQIQPDLVLGWDQDASRRKPAPWPALHALEYFGAKPTEALVVDDLSPGVKMAKAAGLEVVAAGWGHSVEPIQEYMRKECRHYFETVQEFADFLLAPASP
ncbi:unnamed protein product [Cladocopium goreaui]|uniref:Uncharacterized protein n=1 Tax=Cladocopium goreaui TaxID=2562237 RepID=A0A9P1DVE9_9DINO|nr:unnamed protein product [Cladocopium goreaui]